MATPDYIYAWLDETLYSDHSDLNGYERWLRRSVWNEDNALREV